MVEDLHVAASDSELWQDSFWNLVMYRIPAPVRYASNLISRPLLKGNTK
ncbi:hypothetical protein [Paenibacillus sp. YPG26]|nr:hypothetical protein [Paenibacillus sp. YPG26]USB31840.1 hypothetical protein LDO05_10805 [Paenibacillus sp. YPG26]